MMASVIIFYSIINGMIKKKISSTLTSRFEIVFSVTKELVFMDFVYKRNGSSTKGSYVLMPEKKISRGIHLYGKLTNQRQKM